MIQTIDEMIARLTKLKEEHGGQTRVVLSGRKGFHTFDLGAGRAGVATPFKAVSRGGEAVVIITSSTLF